MEFRFISPLDGQMLTDVAGTRLNDSLQIKVKVEASKDRKILINNTAAVWENGAYIATINLDGYRNTIEATDEDGNSIKEVLYWIPNATNGFSLSVDDNIWFLQDLAAYDYNSIFDNPYLNFFKEIHDKYGVKVRLNLYYATDRNGGFNLSQMPDKYKGEFIANNDWLHFAFHCDVNNPTKRYSETDYAKLKSDYDSIRKEVIRFSGCELERCTTIHFVSGNRQTIRAIRAEGVRCLMAISSDENGNPKANYYLNDEEAAMINEYGFWKDHSEDMIFAHLDIVMNRYDANGVKKRLDDTSRFFPKKGFIEIMIHEQYFYTDIFKSDCNFRESVISGVEWCIEHGYKPMFTCDAVSEW